MHICKNIKEIKLDPNGFFSTSLRYRWCKAFKTLYGKDQPWGYLAFNPPESREKIGKSKDSYASKLVNVWQSLSYKSEIKIIYKQNCVPSLKNIDHTEDVITILDTELLKTNSKMLYKMYINMLDKEQLINDGFKLFSSYQIAKPKNILVALNKTFIHPKYNSILWNISTANLPFGYRLKLINTISPFCFFCKKEKDSIPHRYFTCKLVSKIWNRLTKVLYKKAYDYKQNFLFNGLEEDIPIASTIFTTLLFGIHRSFFEGLKNNRNTLILYTGKNSLKLDVRNNLEFLINTKRELKHKIEGLLVKLNNF